VGGIPDFVEGELEQSDHPVLRGTQLIDRLAPIYESKLWYPLVLNLYGGWRSTTLAQLVQTVSHILGGVEGLILDAACGPGTFGRRVVTGARQVYGVDISLGMLRQGMTYVERDRLDHFYLSRAQVESLPFKDALFDAALCCGSLHLFADTVRALREIGRTMVDGAPLAVMTFVAGDKGILRFPRIRAHVRRDHGAHVFDLPELEGYLAQAGFDEFRPQTFGSVLVFGARKRQLSRKRG
jgi:ubiquinone/menaquinone biosynthesis C-methylase UbiE